MIKERISQAFQLFEENQFKESTARYEDLLTENLTIEEEIQLRFGYGYLLSALGRVEEAVENYEHLGELGRQISKFDIVSQALHQIGMVYRQAKQYEKAIARFEQEQLFIEQHFSSNHLFIAANLYELGYTHLLNGKKEVAYSYLIDSLNESKLTNDSVMIACAQRGLGEFYLKQNKPDSASAYLEESFLSFQEAGDEIGAQEIKEMLKKL